MEMIVVGLVVVGAGAAALAKGWTPLRFGSALVFSSALGLGAAFGAGMAGYKAGYDPTADPGLFTNLTGVLELLLGSFLGGGVGMVGGVAAVDWIAGRRQVLAGVACGTAAYLVACAAAFGRQQLASLTLPAVAGWTIGVAAAVTASYALAMPPFPRIHWRQLLAETGILLFFGLCMVTGLRVFTMRAPAAPTGPPAQPLPTPRPVSDAKFISTGGAFRLDAFEPIFQRAAPSRPRLAECFRRALDNPDPSVAVYILKLHGGEVWDVSGQEIIRLVAEESAIPPRGPGRVSALLRAGANPNSRGEGLAYSQALYVAVTNGNVSLVKSLLKSGADTRTPPGKRTLLDWARINGRRYEGKPARKAAFDEIERLLAARGVKASEPLSATGQ